MARVTSGRADAVFTAALDDTAVMDGFKRMTNGFEQFNRDINSAQSSSGKNFVRSSELEKTAALYNHLGERIDKVRPHVDALRASLQSLGITTDQQARGSVNEFFNVLSLGGATTHQLGEGLNKILPLIRQTGRR